jgi:hypothetical protein
MADDLIESTTLFWWDVIKSNQNHRGFSAFLAPYCRLQDDFGDNSRGVNGKVKCEMKLIELKNRIHGARLNPIIRHIQLMNSRSASPPLQPSSRQTRFLISDHLQISSQETLLASIGIAIEWQHGFIIGIVISRNVLQDSFFQHLSPSLSTTSLLSVENKTTATPSSEQEDGYESMLECNGGFILGHSLSPPFLVPKPPFIPPTLSLIIMSCHNLQSRLIRFFSRPIHCRITIRVGNLTQVTPVIKNSQNPIFSSSPFTAVPYLFQIPPHTSVTGALEIIIEDHFPFPANILSRVHIPYSLLPLQEDTMISNEMFIRLSLNQPYLLATLPPPPPSPSSMTSSLPSSPTSSTVPPQEISSQYCSIGDSPKIQKEIFTDLVPYLRIRVSKVDVYQWWIMRELQARDQVREDQIAQLEKEADLSLGDERMSSKQFHCLSEPPPQPPFAERDSVIGSDETESDWDKYKYESMRWITSKELW